MSTFLGSGILALWLDVAPDLDKETDAWYVDEHLPERIDIGGYLRARRYHTLQGAPAYLTLFEASTPMALASEGYLSLVKRISPQSQRIRAGFSNVVRNTFEVRKSVGRGIGGIMGSLRLTARDGASLASVSAMDMLMPRLLEQHGVVGAHWIQAAPEVRAGMDSVRAVGQQDRSADYALLVEATRAGEISRLREDLLSPARLEQMGWREDGFAIYGLLYEVSKDQAP